MEGAGGQSPILQGVGGITPGFLGDSVVVSRIFPVRKTVFQTLKIVFARQKSWNSIHGTR
jgi:hypothetical protein